MNLNAKFPSQEMAHNATRAWTLAKSIRIAMVTSFDGVLNGPDGARSSGSEELTETTFATTPLRARFLDNSNCLFFILSRSNLTHSAQQDHPMLVTFSTGADGDHVAFQGLASVCEDRKTLQQIWDAHADIRYPEGPGSTAVGLLQFEPRTALYWTGGADVVSFAIHYINAKLTGEGQVIGDRGSVSPA